MKNNLILFSLIVAIVAANNLRLQFEVQDNGNWRLNHTESLPDGFNTTVQVFDDFNNSTEVDYNSTHYYNYTNESSDPYYFNNNTHHKNGTHHRNGTHHKNGTHHYNGTYFYNNNQTVNMTYSDQEMQQWLEELARNISQSENNGTPLYYNTSGHNNGHGYKHSNNSYQYDFDGDYSDDEVLGMFVLVFLFKFVLAVGLFFVIAKWWKNRKERLQYMRQSQMNHANQQVYGNSAQQYYQFQQPYHNQQQQFVVNPQQQQQNQYYLAQPQYPQLNHANSQPQHSQQVPQNFDHQQQRAAYPVIRSTN